MVAWAGGGGDFGSERLPFASAKEDDVGVVAVSSSFWKGGLTGCTRGVVGVLASAAEFDGTGAGCIVWTEVMSMW